MKIYQIMYNDGYYPSWPMNDKVFTSKEAARKDYESDPPLESYSPNPDHQGPKPAIKLFEDECEWCTYFIAERDLVDVQ